MPSPLQQKCAPAFLLWVRKKEFKSLERIQSRRAALASRLNILCRIVCPILTGLFFVFYLTMAALIKIPDLPIDIPNYQSFFSEWFSLRLNCFCFYFTPERLTTKSYLVYFKRQFVNALASILNLSRLTFNPVWLGLIVFSPISTDQMNWKQYYDSQLSNTTPETVSNTIKLKVITLQIPVSLQHEFKQSDDFKFSKFKFRPKNLFDILGVSKAASPFVFF